MCNDMTNQVTAERHPICMVEGCNNLSTDESSGRGKAYGIEYDVWICEKHREWMTKDSLRGVSISEPR